MQYLASLPDRVHVLDDDLAANLQQAFARHPWVAAVEDVRVAHEAGLAVAPWATSDPEILHSLVAAGVDAIGTNHPDVLHRVLEAGK